MPACWRWSKKIYKDFRTLREAAGAGGAATQPATPAPKTPGSGKRGRKAKGNDDDVDETPTTSSDFSSNFSSIGPQPRGSLTWGFGNSRKRSRLARDISDDFESDDTDCDQKDGPDPDKMPTCRKKPKYHAARGGGVPSIDLVDDHKDDDEEAAQENADGGGKKPIIKQEPKTKSTLADSAGAGAGAGDDDNGYGDGPSGYYGSFVDDDSSASHEGQGIVKGNVKDKDRAKEKIPMVKDADIDDDLKGQFGVFKREPQDEEENTPYGAA
ncbi:hypothetical protein DL769_000367 [Monosporascus sp. CRB-8-3]|nr:hypothetical protein DL769_000367 [Monosporascus sp. CRB-8-3]